MSEDSRRLSQPGVVNEEAFAKELRRRTAENALASPRSPFASRASSHASRVSKDASDEDRGSEHSDNDEEDGPSAEAAGLLDDITVAMVVELGRVTVSAADVVQLRPGQVIELSRSPGEPVDLVVDQKRVGKGELVEIDGELGVRILSLVK